MRDVTQANFLALGDMKYDWRLMIREELQHEERFVSTVGSWGKQKIAEIVPNTKVFQELPQTFLSFMKIGGRSAGRGTVNG